MPTWDPSLYLKFGDERTQPCRDLVHRIPLQAPARIVDLGCGPGNSTAVLAGRWPGAQITGMDSSADMLVSAKKLLPEVTWEQGDISTWTSTSTPGTGLPDLVFSNAALQWVGNHPLLLPHLVEQVAPGGILAVQVPANINAPAHVIMREMANSAVWRSHFPSASVRDWHVHEPGFYYDILAPLSARLDLWVTEYMMFPTGPEGIVQWYQGTGLRPYLDALPDDELRRIFLADYLAEIAITYPTRANGHVEFPFRRLFFIAQRR
ncbi:MAG: methyltransferase domain-containing protein [Candidatus Methylacidiphilales bacterium]|nr:methyltransferase domain-containing protein [Candidatus Methylacidiphilales bacterium]